MKTDKTINVFGASNVDITGFTEKKLIYGDANIGHTITTPGGVGRNIAENLFRLNFKVNLISIFGDDPLSDYLIKSCKDLGLKIKNSLFLKKASAATFLAIMDSNNDLALGISAMDIYKNIDIDSIRKKISELAKTDYTVLETNFPTDILELLVNHITHTKFVLDTVSGKKALRSRPILPHLYILKTNLLEAQMLSGIDPNNTKSKEKLVAYFIDLGVKNVFITTGKEGVIYGNKQLIAQRGPIPSNIMNTIGAGDSFVSGIVYADSLGLDIHKMALYGMASASINVQYDGAVSPKMNVANLEEVISNL